MSCEHLGATGDHEPLSTYADGCPDCVADGHHDWVHLRFCVACGHVGCCDSSPRRHATVHFHAENHPVMRSYEPGESWRWCYIDETVG